MPFRLINTAEKAKSVRQPIRAPIAKDLVIKNGRFVKSNAAASRKPTSSMSTAMTQPASASSDVRRAMPPTSTAQPRLARAAVPTVSQLLGATTAAGILDADDLREKDVELARAPKFATGTNEYIEQIKKDIGMGVLDVKGNPWILPCDPQIAVSRIGSSKTSTDKRPVTSLEVRDLVFRHALYIWAPHLLLPVAARSSQRA